MAFIAALMVMLVAVVLVSGVLAMSISAYRLSASRNEYVEAIYVAESGINKLVSDWRAALVAGNAIPTQPFIGTVGSGSYHLTWADSSDPLEAAAGVIIVTAEGTAQSGLTGTIYQVTRRLQVKLDRDGDWAWNHVYYSDTDSPNMTAPLYAEIKGGGDLEIGGQVGSPQDFVGHPNGPGGAGLLPSPMWNLWHEWVRADLSCDSTTKQQIPRDPDGDGTPNPRWPEQAALGAFTSIAMDAIPDSGGITPRHTYWYGSSTSTPLFYGAHASDSHAGNDVNFFMPDSFGQNNPDAYVCNSSNKRFTVTFGRQSSTDGVYTGNFFVHGDIDIKQNARIRGTLIATGNVTFYGVDNIEITPEAINPDAPCAERVYYPAIIAGRDVLIRDQGNTTPGDPNPSRLRVSGVIWAGNSYTGSASDVEGCVVAPNVTLGGNFLVRYGANLDGCDYTPGDRPPPWFREPDRGQMNPVPRSWREL
jgi:hypothetical protein